MPASLWPTLGAAAVAAFTLKWHLFRTAMACSFKDMLGALLAATALDFTIRMASLWGLLTRHTPWRRTNKFKALPCGLSALGPALHELLLGGGVLTAGISVLVAGHLPGLVRLIGIGWSLQGGRFMTSPLMAMLAEHGISRRARLNSAQGVQCTSNLPARSTEA
jgi:hypothetical protein